MIGETKQVYTGLEGSGKSLMLASDISLVVIRNVKWHATGLPPRHIYSNLLFAPHLIERALSGGIEIRPWKNLEDLVTLSDCDVVIDEVGNYFPAQSWATLPMDVRKWFTQGNKTGVEVYATAQDFAQVDKNFRRLTTKLYEITKIMGSRRPTSTKPPVRYIWGLCMVRDLDPRGYKEDDIKKDKTGLPSFFFIAKDICSLYDTRQTIEVIRHRVLRHDIAICNHINADGSLCGHKKVTHS